MRMWDYELISIEASTSDPDKLSNDFRVKQNRKGEIYFDGYIYFNYDFANFGTMVESSAMRSQAGNENEYAPVIWSIPKETYDEFMENYYKDIIYSNVGSCTNLPEPENIVPWKSHNYTFVNCKIEPHGFPDIVPQGYYRVNFKVTGEVNWGFVGVVRVFDKYGH
ncbi:uncharacterized protein LOC132793293 [Drosophila nasuta]|uniref:uncharacterized protein LOC132793293 n=1 Tax=Drosophila nasuta TaxID=42062 RepID=UPI00295EE07A|nr:uncharacterized protein LOC132793293 [Drosophila nasuta]